MEPPTPQTKNSLVLITSILLIITVGIAGLFYFQIQKLSKELSKYQTRATPTPSTTPDVTANWKTYTDSSLNYSFQYPPTSCELQRFAGDTTFAICYLPKGSDGGSKHNNGYVISLGFISKSQLSVMGVTYCGVYPNDSSRCELFKMGEVTASIDWGTGADGNASAWISHPNGGIVTFDLQPVAAESKEILNQILSTFKFLENEELVIGIQISICCPCPKEISKSIIEKGGWVLYENGKDYTNDLPVSCRNVHCKPCEPIALYTCPLNGWQSCMPILTEEAKKGCTQEAIKWYETNCPNFQGVAQ